MSIETDAADKHVGPQQQSDAQNATPRRDYFHFRRASMADPYPETRRCSGMGENGTATDGRIYIDARDVLAGHWDAIRMGDGR